MNNRQLILSIYSFFTLGNMLLTAQNVGIRVTNPETRLHIDGKVKINGTNALEFGAGYIKEVNAGKLIHQGFSQGLDIVGGGTTSSNRIVNFAGTGNSLRVVTLGDIYAPSLSTYSYLNEGLSALGSVIFRVNNNNNNNYILNSGSTSIDFTNDSNKFAFNGGNGNSYWGNFFSASYEHRLFVNGVFTAKNLLLGNTGIGQYLSVKNDTIIRTINGDLWQKNSNNNLFFTGAKIGVNTSSPQHALHINGTVKTDSLRIQVAPNDTYLVTSTINGMDYFKPSFERWTFGSGQLIHLGSYGPGFTYSLGAQSQASLWSITNGGQTNLKFGFDNIVSLYDHHFHSSGLLDLNQTTAIASPQGITIGENRSLTSKINIDGTGNVGIGLSPTSAKLEVNGTTKIEKLKVGANGSIMSRLQKGNINISKPGAGSPSIKTISFQSGYFSTPPKVIATVKAGSSDTQVYSITTTNITSSGVTFIVYRLDSNLNWPAEPIVEWMAVQ